MNRIPAFLTLLLLSLTTACTEPSSAPAVPGSPALELRAEAQCPAARDFVVRSEAELVAALAAAVPGAVIAVDGVIEVSGFQITTPDLTLTCATPGSGLRVRALAGFLMHVSAPRVTVERLTLDASASDFGAYIANNQPSNQRFAEDIRLVGNRIICGSTPFCVVYGGFPDGPVAHGGLVADNHFTATGSQSALQFHEVDEVQVERNTLVGSGAFQGIRVTNQPWRLGRIVIAHNTLAGSWFDPLFVLNTDGAQILGNTVTCGSNSCLFGSGPGLHGTAVADNSFTSAGSGRGVHLESGVEGARIERNTIVSTAAAPDGIFASAIAVMGGANVAVTDNVVGGPWTEAALALVGIFGGRVEGNRLEGALDDGVDLFGSEDVQFLNNTVQCGGSCFFANASPRAVIAGNHFESGGSLSGVHLQNGTDGDRIERNTIVATAPSTGFGFGGIRVRDGSNVVVAGNVVRGPWSNSLASTNLVGSRFENNQLQGAGVNGIRFNVGPFLMIDNVFRENLVTGAGDAGIFAQWACRNTFLGNSIEGTGRNPSVIFDATTGGNVLVLVGAKNLVIDNGGSFGECNFAPNIIAGPGRVVRGVAVGASAGIETGTSSKLR
jgi:hypothetical protein